MSTENKPEKDVNAEPEHAAEGEEQRPLNRAERRAQGKKGPAANPFGGGGGHLPLGQRLQGGAGPAANKSRFNRKVGGK